jgi:GTP-binding protein EngB required for normal cell division
MRAEGVVATMLADVAARLLPLLPVERRTGLAEAVERAAAGRVRILVVGEAKRGKSTLVNALFERDLLPTGALPLTSVASVVTVAGQVGADVRYRDGRAEQIGLDAVAGLVSQRGNPDNVRGVDRVAITAPSRWLPAGTEVVDTPGTGSVHRANTDEAARARSTVDIVVLVVAADPPVSAAELALVAETLTTAAAAAVVVNKTDLVAPGDLAEILTFTRDATRTALGGVDVPTFPMSLREAGPGGVAGLVGWLTGRLAAPGGADVVAATARALRREAVGVLDGLRVEHEVLCHTGQRSTDVVAALRDILDRAATSATAAVDHARGEARRARVVLDEQHDREVAEALRAARAELGGALPGRDTPERAATELRQRIGDLVVSRCSAWFD